MSVICNHDCFNCQYPDCMNDDITLGEYREIAERDAEIKWQNSLKTDSERQKLLNLRAYHKANADKERAYKMAYREVHKERLRAYDKAYYEINKDRKCANKKAWNEANKEHVCAYGKAYNKAHKEQRKAYLEANKEQINARQRAYRAAQKLANAANHETLTTTRQVQNGI